MRLNAPKRATPKHEGYRRNSAEIVRRRWFANGYRCEGCGKEAMTVEVAHLFGRRHIVGEPMASDPVLLAALCCARTWGDRTGCHESIDRNENTELRDRLRWAAVDVYAAQRRITVNHGDFDDPIAAARWLEEEGNTE